MKTWVYEGNCARGEIITGEIKASSVIMAQIALRSNGILVIRIHELQKTGGFWKPINKIAKTKKANINSLSINKVDLTKLRIATTHKGKINVKKNQ